MALAKIVGFEVAPDTPQSAISDASPPVSSSSRESVSSQIATPASRRACRRSWALVSMVVSLRMTRMADMRHVRRQSFPPARAVGARELTGVGHGSGDRRRGGAENGTAGYQGQMATVVLL